MNENKITKRSDLFREYARVIDMCEGTNIMPYMCVKCMKMVMTIEPNFHGNSVYEFALAIVEDRPVFKGDVLWTKHGHKMTVNDMSFIDILSWQEPKRTITINGKEYPAPVRTIQHQSDDKIRYSMPCISDYYFDTIKDADAVAKAIGDMLNGK